MFWHFARDDSMFTTIRIISKHQDTQVYGAILPQHLTNQAMLKSEAYKTYHAYDTGEKIPKPKYVKNKADPESSPKKKSTQASEGKRLKTSAKVTKSAKKKQPATTSKAKGLNALSKAEQIKLATKRSLIQTYISHASGSGVDEGTGVTPGVPDVPTYDSEDEHISWKSSDEDDDDEVNMSEDDDNQDDDNADNEGDDDQDNDNADNEGDDDQNDDNTNNEGDDDQDDDNEQTESDNDDGNFFHPKLSTFDEKERQDEEDKKKSGLLMKHLMKKLKESMLRKKNWMRQM
ncbi:hypothetical protein Tco_1125820 [Tanacetum coccineum]